MTGFPVRAAADNNYTAIYKLADSCQVGTILHCFSWKYDDINHYETQLVLQDNVSQSQIDSIISKVDGTPLMTKSIIYLLCLLMLVIY